MDFGFFGAIDIAIVLIFLIVLFVGFKVGFLDKFLSLSKTLCGFLFALIFCNSFASTLVDWGAFYPSIYEKIYSNISEKAGVTDLSTASELYEKIGFPSFIADMLAKTVSGDSGSIIDLVASNVSHFIMVIIAFLLLFFGTTLLFFILKFIVTILRQSKFIRVCDGIFGMAFFAILFVVVIYIAGGILSLVIDLDALSDVKEFLTIDMQLGEDEFRLSKYFYEHNILVNILKLFF